MREWCGLDWWGSEWLYHSYRIWIHGDRLKWLLDCWSIECFVINDEWWFQYEMYLLNVPVWMRVDRDDSNWLYSYSSTQTIYNSSHSISNHYDLNMNCVISDNLSFNISCFHHSIWYTIHTLYQHLLFISTHSTIYTLSERWYRDE